AEREMFVTPHRPPRRSPPGFPSASRVRGALPGRAPKTEYPRRYSWHGPRSVRDDVTPARNANWVQPTPGFESCRRARIRKPGRDIDPRRHRFPELAWPDRHFDKSARPGTWKP